MAIVLGIRSLKLFETFFIDVKCEVLEISNTDVMVAEKFSSFSHAQYMTITVLVRRCKVRSATPGSP